MAHDMQFVSNTMKYEEDSLVQGSDGLYVFQFGTGSSMDLKQELINYHAKKAGVDGLVKNTQAGRTVGDYYWGLFKKPKEQSYEDFVEDVKNYRVGFIGNSPLLPTGRDYTHVDLHGNLLVATINSGLENYTDCGNMLINGVTGEVLRDPKPSVIINPVDPVSGYYPIEVYKTRTDSKNGNKEVYDREFNFIDKDGHILTDEFDFELKDEQLVIKIPRDYTQFGGKEVGDLEVMPMAYVVCNWDKVQMFDNVAQLLTQNHLRKVADDALIVEDEDEYIHDLQDRIKEIPNITHELRLRFSAGIIAEESYNIAMDRIREEIDEIKYYKNIARLEMEM